MAWQHFFTNAGLFLTAEVALPDRIGYWNSSTLMSLTWCAETWDLSSLCLQAVDRVGIEMVRKMMDIARKAIETWLEFYIRSFRLARAVAYHSLKFPSQFLTKHWRWTGHLARLSEDRHANVATILTGTLTNGVHSSSKLKNLQAGYEHPLGRTHPILCGHAEPPLVAQQILV